MFAPPVDLVGAVGHGVHESAINERAGKFKRVTGPSRNVGPILEIPSVKVPARPVDRYASPETDKVPKSGILPDAPFKARQFRMVDKAHMNPEV